MTMNLISSYLEKMKSIPSFRHGKSDWNAKYEGDHNRPLSKRGIKAAKLMGEYLFNIKQVPEKIISSTAIRAKTTAELALKYGNWNSCLHLNLIFIFVQHTNEVYYN